MRTFLTYVLAALSLALVFGVVDLADRIWGLAEVSGLQPVDPRVMAYSMTNWLIGFVANLLVGGSLAGLIWFGVSRLSSPSVSSLRAHVIQGVAVVALITLVILAVMAVISGLAVVGQSIDSVVEIILGVTGLILAGAAWGTVSWIRAPKPTTAGIAA